MSTGLMPNFMGIWAEPLFASNRGYYDELDSTLATFRYVLNYLWFEANDAKTHFAAQAQWWLSRHPSCSLHFNDSFSEFELNGGVRSSSRTPVRAGGMGVTAMVAESVIGCQNTVNGACAIIRDYPHRNSSFRDPSKFIQLLVLTGQFPSALVSPLEKDSDGDRLPDAWKDTHVLDPHDPADALLDLDRDLEPGPWRWMVLVRRKRRRSSVKLVVTSPAEIVFEASHDAA